MFVESLPQPFQDEIKGISNATGIEIGEYSIHRQSNKSLLKLKHQLLLNGTTLFSQF